MQNNPNLFDSIKLLTNFILTLLSPVFMKNYILWFTKFSAVILVNLICLNAYSQKVATMEVLLKRPAYGMNLPVSINLDEMYLPV